MKKFLILLLLLILTGCAGLPVPTHYQSYYPSTDTSWQQQYRWYDFKSDFSYPCCNPY